MGCDRALKHAGKCPGASLGRSGEGPSPWERALEERREVCAGAAGGAAAPVAQGAGHCAGRQRWRRGGPCVVRGWRWEAVLCLRGSHPVLTSGGSDAGMGQLLKRLQSRRHGRITSRGIVCALSHAVPLRPLEWVLGLKWGRRTEGQAGRPSSSVPAERVRSGSGRSGPCELGAAFTASILACCLICSPLIEQMRCRQRGWASIDFIRGKHQYNGAC